jgi:mono/diheme cytochrome c family protein
VLASMHRCLAFVLGTVLAGAFAHGCDSNPAPPAPAEPEPIKSGAAAPEITTGDDAPKRRDAGTPAGAPDLPDAGNPDDASASDGEAPARDSAPDRPEDDGSQAKGPEPTPDQPEPEPKKAEPKKTEPKKAEPKKTEPKKTEPKKTEPAKTEPATTASGKDVYLQKCKNCHGVKGDADTKIGRQNDIPSWKEPGWKGKWPISKVKDIVINGKGGTKMKPFKSKLTPEEIDAVSEYARSLGA